VSSVESTFTAETTRQVTVTLIRENEWSVVGLLRDVSYNVQGRTYSPDHLTEIAIRNVLFGEPIPFERGFGFREMDNPSNLYGMLP
ncbi:MAG TPA: hypothetical protein VLA54_05370, partial [Acidimicrobiia bacterium]|nr:hypothetical protein [Acidimicrobiia bacterium]